MNRRQFFLSAGAVAAIFAIDPKKFVSTPLPSINQIFDGFAEIEQYDYLVENVYVHPDDVSDFLKMMQGHVGWDAESLKFVNSEGVLGYFHGAVVAVQPDLQLRRNVWLASQTEFDKRWWTPPMWKRNSPTMIVGVHA